MNNIFQRISLFLGCLLLNAALQAGAEDKLEWNVKKERVNADIRSWNLDTTLEKISSAAGWEVYVEPGSTQEVSVKFNDLPVDEALKKMLGKLSFALLPQTNAAPRFYVFRTSMGNATKLVAQPSKKRSDNNPDVIENELIVVLKPDAGITIEELAKQLGAKIVARDDKNHAYRLRFENAEATEEARVELKNNPHVASVESNFRLHPQRPVAELPLASTSPFPLNPTAKNDPNSLIVAVIDSPVQELGNGMDDFLLSPIGVAGESAEADGPMHGTFMTQALMRAFAACSQAGASPLKIQPIDVYGRRTTTTTFEIGLGVNAAVSGGAKIVNMSLGTYGNSSYLETLIRNSRRQGVLFFGAAGNDPVADPVYPAAYADVNGVTAGKDGQLDPYANRYSGNDMMIPGKSLGQFQGESYMVSGTSSSSASASGLAACLMAKGFSPAAVERALRGEFPYNPGQ